LPFKEPFEPDGSVSWRGNNEAIATELERLITTGYVPMTHYDDKPMTGVEYFNLMKSKGINLSYLRESMHVRLALVAHMSNQRIKTYKGDDQNHFACLHGNPPCMNEALRSIHSGCDFQIDEELTGFRSRLFECNKGPDMHVHNVRDGDLKIGVAADMVSFLGLSGPFDDTPEYARRFNMTKIYDSLTFNEDRAFEYLDSLETLPSQNTLLLNSRVDL